MGFETKTGIRNKDGDSKQRRGFETKTGIRNKDGDSKQRIEMNKYFKIL